MTTFDRKLCRDLWRNLGMLSAVAAIIAVGTGSFIGMLGAYNNLDFARKNYYAESRMADFWVDLKKAPVTEIERLRDIQGISDLRSRISFPVVIDLPDTDKPIGGQVLSMPERKTATINDIVIRSGGYFGPDRRNEAIVSEKFAAAHQIKPGDNIPLIMNGRRKTLVVVGTAIGPEHIYTAPPGGIVDNPKDYGVLYIKHDYAEDVFGFEGAANSVVGLLTKEARANPEQVLRLLAQRLDDYGVFTVTPLTQQFSNLMLSSELGGLQSMATMLPILFLSVAALVLNVLMTRMAEQQRTIVGTLKALGHTNRKILAHFIKYGVIVGFAGGSAGCFLGCWIANGMTLMYNNFFTFPELSSRIYWDLLFVSLLISAIFAVLGSLRGVRNVSQLNPAEAMREPAPPLCDAILLEKWSWFWRKLDFRWQIIMRGLFRNKVRTSIGIGAAAIGASLVILGFGFVDSMNAMMNFQFNKVMLSDYNLVLKKEISSAALSDIERLPGVILAEPVLHSACTFRNGNHYKKGTVTGIVRDAVLTIPRASDGTTAPIPETGLLMTKRLAMQLDVQPGESISFTPVKGERREQVLQVANTVDSMIGLSVYSDFDYLNKLIDESSSISEIRIRARQTPKEKRDFFRALKRSPYLQSIEETAAQKKIMNKQLTGSMQGMAVVMIIFAGVIFFGSILNGSLIAIAERQREIATFRVLGYMPSEIGSIFLRENTLVNMCGALIGLPLGSWMLDGMMTQFSNDAYSMPSVLTPSSWWWTLFLSFFFIICAHGLVRRAIRKINWTEALSMKE